MDPRNLETLVPVWDSLENRVRMAERCRDADHLPKVENAGAVVLGPDGQRVQIMHNGIKVVAGGYAGDWMTDLITRCRGHHEPAEEAAFHEVLQHAGPNATMIELGGFWSFYSIWFLKGQADRRAIVLEPDPKHLEMGMENARLNACAPEFVNAFVGASAVPSVPFETEDSGVVTLDRMSVPSLMADRGIQHLDILHCDCQGAEFEVLDACDELFAAGRISWVVVSTHTHHISGDPLTHQRCLAMLKNVGGTIVVEHDVQESFSGDGLIVAKFGPLPSAWRAPPVTYNRYSHSLFRNPLYDLASPRPNLDAKQVASFLKTADEGTRNRLFDEYGATALSDLLYVERQGLRYLVHSKDQIISRGLFVQGVADYQKLETALSILRTEAPDWSGKLELLVDVGANIGGICIPAVARGLAGSALAIEPDRTNCQLLRANISINGLYGQIDVIERAAGPSDGETLTLELSSDNWGDHRVSFSRSPGAYGESDRRHTTVQSISLDTALAQKTGAGTLIWMDTQGYEGHVLRGARRTLASRPPLVLEFWPYGMQRAGSYVPLRELISHYRGYYDLETQGQLRPLAELDQLFADLLQRHAFTDILVV